MVYIGGGGEESVRRRDGASMSMRTERSKPPLHNFNLPFLKWGTQRQLRCIKVSDSSNSSHPRNGGGGGGGGISFTASDRHRRSSRSPPSKFAANSTRHHHHQSKKSKPVIGGADEGIEAVRKKIMFDLKTAADRMKQEILRKEVCVEEEEDEEEEEEHGDGEQQAVRRRSSPPADATAGAVEKEHEARPWNLRTRRAACKAPAAAPIGASPATGKGLKIEESSYSPTRKREREDENKLLEKPRAKFSVPLSRKEIEDDFMAMVGHRPARRPKKRARIVQKQWDAFSPGFWLGEVTVETYKVPEIPADTGKR